METTVRKQKGYHFTKGKGKSIIARNDEGKIVIINKDSKNKFRVKHNEDWLCNIIQVDENKIIVDPVECIKTSAANNYEYGQKIEDLKNSGKFKVNGK